MIFSLHRHQTVRAIYCHNDNLSHMQSQIKCHTITLFHFGDLPVVSSYLLFQEECLSVFFLFTFFPDVAHFTFHDVALIRFDKIRYLGNSK